MNRSTLHLHRKSLLSNVFLNLSFPITDSGNDSSFRYETQYIFFIQNRNDLLFCFRNFFELDIGDFYSKYSEN